MELPKRIRFTVTEEDYYEYLRRATYQSFEKASDCPAACAVSRKYAARSRVIYGLSYIDDVPYVNSGGLKKFVNDVDLDYMVDLPKTFIITRKD